MPDFSKRLKDYVAKVSRAVHAPLRAAGSSSDPPVSIDPDENILRRCDSMMVMYVNAHLRREFPGRQISPRLIFDKPTIDSIASTLCSSEAGDTSDDDDLEGSASKA